jgi:hypothetical protein
VTTIRVRHLDGDRYGVHVHEGEISEEREADLDRELVLDDMALVDADGALLVPGELIVEEMVRFMLDRLDAAQLPNPIEMRHVDRHYDDFRTELADRIAARSDAI